MPANKVKAIRERQARRALATLEIVLKFCGALTKEQLDTLNRRGRSIGPIKRGDAFFMRKGWWQTGERKPIRAQKEFQIWERSKSTVCSNPESRTGKEEEEGEVVFTREKEDQW